jgi:cytidylate kinase
MTIITLSRQLGSGGSYIATDVAKALGLRLFDREIFYRAAAAAGVSADALRRLEEEPRGVLQRLVDALLGQPRIPNVPTATLRESADYEERVGRLMERTGLDRQAAVTQLQASGTGWSPGRRDAAPLSGLTDRQYGDLMYSIVRQLASQGDVLIVGRGGCLILADWPDTFHAQIVAPLEDRVERVMERENLNWKDALRRVQDSDAARSDYFQRHFKVSWLRSSLYDLVINTGKVHLDDAVSWIASAASRPKTT